MLANRGQESIRSAFSPFRNLNDDVLRLISVACLDDEPHPTTSRRRAPLLLGRVCRRFRTVVLTTPALWSAVSIRSVRKPTVQVQAMEWLSRAGQLPLRIWTQPLSSASESASRHAPDLLRSFRTAIRRVQWKRGPFNAYRGSFEHPRGRLRCFTSRNC